MSKNLSALAGRTGTQDSLFEQLVTNKPAPDDPARKALAKKHLIGEANVKGSASFYDFIEGSNANKKAYLCNGSSCTNAGTQAFVRQRLEQHFNPDNIGHIMCLGLCNKNSSFRIGDSNYSGADINNLAQFIGQPNNPATPDAIHAQSLTGPAILTTPVSNVDWYYQAFTRAIEQYDAEQLLAQISDSGLRGRGGAGFPTGFKWSACRKANDRGLGKYIVCNADEGDPGAFSDRYLLEQNPHSVLFGMMMAGWLTGADEGILYIRAEYPAAIAVCQQAIDLLAQKNLLTHQHDGQSWQFKFKIIQGAGAYICGEETALLRSIEGQRPVVSVRPPFPTDSGLYGQPTALNNVETFASIHWILTQGSEAFKALGNGRSSGTKLLSLDGCFNRPGIYEVEMGTPLQQVIHAAKGFAYPIKALHIGGPLGGIVPPLYFDKLTVDFESFAEHHFLLGHASFIGIPESTPIIHYMRHLFDFTAAESCGKCVPCRIGATRGEELLGKAIDNEIKIDRELLDDLLETMKLGSLCALGGGVPLPLENALQWFAAELDPHFQSQQRIDIKEISS